MWMKSEMIRFESIAKEIRPPSARALFTTFIFFGSSGCTFVFCFNKKRVNFIPLRSTCEMCVEISKRRLLSPYNRQKNSHLSFSSEHLSSFLFAWTESDATSLNNLQRLQRKFVLSDEWLVMHLFFCGINITSLLKYVTLHISVEFRSTLQ